MGYIYIISNPDYEKDVYKIGYTTTKNQSTKKDPRKALIQRYSTYSAKEPVIEEIYEINDDTCDQAEKILFELLKKYRVNKKREFFKCDLYHIKECCLRTQSLVETTCDTKNLDSKPLPNPITKPIEKPKAKPKQSPIKKKRERRKKSPRPLDFLFQDVKKDMRKKGLEIKKQMGKEGLIGTIMGSIVNNGIKKLSDGFDPK